MAITFVKTVGNFNNRVGTGITSAPITVPVAGVASGDFVVVALACNGNFSADTITCTDTAGNTYTNVSNGSGSSANGIMFAGPITNALVSGNTITIAWTTAEGAVAAVATQFTGVASSSFTDNTLVATNAAATGTAITSTAITTTNANDLIFAWWYDRVGTSTATVTVTEDVTFTNDGANSSVETTGTATANSGTTTTSGGIFLHVAWRIVTATETRTYTATSSSSQVWRCGIASFKAAVAAAAAKRLALLGVG